MKRFMGRYGLTLRRKNDNASKSIDQLLPHYIKFVNGVRLLRCDNPDASDPAQSYGLFGPWNTLNVDQVPLCIAEPDYTRIHWH